MAVEEVRMRLRRKLEGMLGEDEAAMLMDRPPGGWGDLVTNTTLNARFDAIERRFDAIDYRFEALEHKMMATMERCFRDQTWRLMTAMIAMMSVLVAAFGVMLVIAGR
jgi:hypothetical protein